MAFFPFKKKAHFLKKTPTPVVIFFHFISFFLTFSLPLLSISVVTSALVFIMAVVNSPYVGIARGRLGEGVYSRVKGQTTVRGYNPSPMNPRSSGQQSQRAQFSSAVKFFSRGVQNFFKFAFENKAEKESDYNAFMRINANRGMYFGPEQNATPEYPAIGRFIMTRGSLPSLDYFMDSGLGFIALVPKSSGGGTQPTTLGALSSLLIENGYQQGDIVTFCVINTDWLAGDDSQPLVYGSDAPVWSIKQFTIDSASTATLTSLGIDLDSWDSYNWSLSMSQDMEESLVAAGCVCVSRPSSSGLKVSSSTLWLNSQAQRALIYGQSPAWRAIVLEAWRTSGSSILQGSRSVNRAQQTTVELATDPVLPYSIDTSGVLEVYFNDQVTLDSLAAHLVMECGTYGVMTTAKSGQKITFTAPDESTSFLEGTLDDENVLSIDNTTQNVIAINALRWV